MSLSTVSATPTASNTSPTSSSTTYTSNAAPFTQALVEDAVTLSTQGDLISSLNGTPLTYTAQGLLNNFNALQQSGTADTITSPTTSALNTTTGGDTQALSSLSTDAAWAQVLQTAPELAGQAGTDSTIQQIINTLA